MAKTGFQYWSVETDRYQDMKLKRLKKEHKGIGVAVYDYITNEIYRDKGCYIEWDDSTVFDVAEFWDIKESHLQEIVNYCCHVGLFDKALLASESILSSKAHLTRWIDWSKKAKREKIEIPEKLKKLLEEKPKLPEGSTGNSGSFSQSKVTEHNRTESNQSTSAPAVPSPASGSGKSVVKKAAGKGKAKGEDPPEPYWQVLVDTWIKFGKENFGEEPSFKGRDPKFLKEIAQLLKKRAEKKQQAWDETSAPKRLLAFLQSAMAVEWLKKHFLLENLYKQFDVIIRTRVNANGTAVTGPPPATQLPKVEHLTERNLAYLLDRYIEDPSAVTIRSIEYRDFDWLKKNGKIQFSDDDYERVRLTALDYMRENEISHTPENETKWSKAFGVLEYLKMRRDETLKTQTA